MARRAIAEKVNSENDIQKLKGLIPVVEDWYTKLCFLVVSIIFSLSHSDLHNVSRVGTN